MRPTARKKAGYFKLSVKENAVFNVVIYYMDGVKQMEGIYLSVEPEVKEGHFIFYDNRGLKTSEGDYAADKKYGKWTTYFPGTQRVQKINEYKNDHLDGLCILNDSVTGNRINSRYYKEGLLDGKFTNYFVTTKKLRSVLEYKKGLLTGLVVHYDSASGYKWGTGYVVDDHREGEWTMFYLGSEDTLARFNYVKGRKQGRALFFYRSGNIVAEGAYESGDKQDQWKYYYDKEGALRYTINFFQGWYDGDVNYFDSATGKLRHTGKFVNGVRSGKWTGYFPETGKIESVETYMLGRLDGEAAEYFASGKESYSGSFYRNIPVKTHFTYYEDGTIKSKADYPGNVGYGTIIVYDSATHKVMQKGENSAGRRVGMWYYYYKGTDQLSVKLRYKNGLGEGEYVSFYDDGSKEVTGKLKNGKKTGEWIFYYKESGNEWLRLNFEDGELNGDVYGYYEDGKTKRHDVFKSGEWIESDCFSEYGEKIKSTPLYTKAKFADGDVFTFIGNELKYPEVSRSQGIHGKVVVQFLVNEDGRISDIEVTQGLDKDCDAEAIRIIKAMPLWQPAQLDDRKLKWIMSLPIVFWIPDSEREE